MDFSTILFALLPGLAWLFFYLQEDLHPEPKRLVVATFLAGASFAFFALLIEISLHSIFTTLGVAEASVLALTLLALVEEIFKFGAAYFAVHKQADFDEPVDAMIYTVIAALGFATIENIGAIHSNGTVPQAALLLYALEVASLRFVGATLLHALTSALAGYYWAISIREFYATRFIVWGIALATVLHSLFNYLIITFGNVMYPVLLVTFIGFFVLNDFEKLKQKAV